MMNRKTVRTLVLASLAAPAWSQRVCTDPNSADGLSRAVDAAIMQLQGQKGWFHQLRNDTGYANAMSVFSCTPDTSRWEYPAANGATGILGRVLSSGKLKVAGVQWATSSGAADYKTNPLAPSGFWPDYMAAITAKIAQHYAVAITLERVYYPNSVLVVDAVAAGVDVDMSEPYYYLSGFHSNAPRIETLAFSCITAGLASKFFTKRTGGATSVDQLFDVVAGGPNRAVGFIGQGNYDAVSAMLPDSTSPSFVTNTSDMAANVLSGALVAGYVSEGEPPDAALFNVFETGIVSPRVALFRKDDPGCSTPGAQVSATLAADTTVYVTALVVIGAVALVLSVLLATLIACERRGKAVFMPLLTTTAVDTVKAANEAI